MVVARLALKKKSETNLKKQVILLNGIFGEGRKIMSNPENGGYVIFPNDDETEWEIWKDCKLIKIGVKTAKDCWEYIDRIENPIEDILKDFGYKEVRRVR